MCTCLKLGEDTFLYGVYLETIIINNYNVQIYTFSVENNPSKVEML